MAIALLMVTLVAPVSLVRAHSTDHLAVAVDSTTTAGVATSTLTVEARDGTEAIDPTYDGTVTFTSGDASAVLPADYTFTVGDGGSHTFTVTFKTAGSATITATDTTTSSVSGTSNASVVSPGPAASLSASGYPTPTVAGAAHPLTVTAFDTFGNVATGYTGIVGLTSNDPQFTPPADHAFSAGDAGTHDFSAALKQGGTWKITATDQAHPPLKGSQSGIFVGPAAAATLAVAGFTSPASSGVSDTFTVTAKDAFANTATGYLGTVTFTSDDLAADLPADSTFVAGDNGTKSFSATLFTIGVRSITATDSATGSITGTQSGIVVGAGTLDHFIVAGFPDPTTSGASHPFTVTARDASNNTVLGYTGTVTISTTDPLATPPGPYHFTSGDNGVHVFDLALEKVGDWSIAATDGSATGAQNGITVTPGAAASLSISGAYPSTTVAGDPHDLTVTISDGSGNVATGYRGTVHFTSTDPAAVLPSPHTFTSGDAGVHTFAITFRTAGSRGYTVTDTGDSSRTDSQSGITVSPDTATTLTVTGYPDPNGIGASGSATVTAKDAFGNMATGYTGTVHLTTSGGGSTLPGDHVYTGGEAGVHAFSGISFALPGDWTLTARDTVTASITGFQAAITITDQAPACTLLTVSTQENTPVDDSVGSACSDPDHGPAELTYSISSGPSHGAVSPFSAATGDFTYIPTAHFSGSDSFVVSVSDGNKTTLATVAVTIGSVNDPPSFTAGLDEVRLEDTVGTVTVNGWASAISPGPGESGQTVDFVVTNDLPALFADQPGVSPEGVLTYTLAPDANGVATVSVKLHDDGGTAGGGSDTSATQTVLITVTPVNDPPTFTPGADQVLSEQSSPTLVTIPAWATGISPGPADESSQVLTITTTTNLANPSLLFATQPSVGPTGTLTFKPAANRSGVATVTVAIQDDGGTANGATDLVSHAFTITVTGVNHAPIAVNDFPTVIAGSPATAIPVLANDDANNPDQGELLTIVSATRPGHGTVRVVGGGTGLTYQPAAGFIGTDRFSYTIRDPGGLTASATVLVTVPRDRYRPVATAPVQSFATPRSMGSGTVSVRLTWSATDRGSGIARYELWRSRNGGAYTRVTLSSARARSATLSLALSGSYRFKVRAVDKVGNVGAFVAGPTFRVRATQETPTSAVVYAGTWGSLSSRSFYGGRERSSVVALDTVTFTFSGRNVAWLTTRSASRGVASIAVDGLPVGFVDTRTTTTRFRQVIWGRSFGALGIHTITITVVGTPGRPRVDVDAFLVIR